MRTRSVVVGDSACEAGSSGSVAAGASGMDSPDDVYAMANGSGASAESGVRGPVGDLPLLTLAEPAGLVGAWLLCVNAPMGDGGTLELARELWLLLWRVDRREPAGPEGLIRLVFFHCHHAAHDKNPFP